jgi:hypothetical protein
MSPSVTSYAGWPEITFASVLLPEPFGPMIAWISPSLISRFTPFRISVPSSATSACRLTILSSGSAIDFLLARGAS